MSNSLNQAFIKAYSKDRKGLGPNEDMEDFIVRVDTATVSIPAPHMLDNQQRDRLPISVGLMDDSTEQRAVKPSPESFPADSTHAVEPLPQGSSPSPEPWSDQPIDAFSGGFPMISAVHAPRPEPSKPNLSDAPEVASQPQDLPPSPAETPATDSEARGRDQRQSQPALDPALDKVAQAAPQNPPATQTPDANQGLGDQEPSDAGGSAVQPEPRELEPPISPGANGP